MQLSVENNNIFYRNFSHDPGWTLNLPDNQSEPQMGIFILSDSEPCYAIAWQW